MHEVHQAESSGQPTDLGAVNAGINARYFQKDNDQCGQCDTRCSKKGRVANAIWPWSHAPGQIVQVKRDHGDRPLAEEVDGLRQALIEVSLILAKAIG
jgi:hypothetical protein